MGSGVWVTGTDTGVGKTVVSAGLVRALADAGVRVAGLKPVVSGVIEDSALPGGGWWEDLARLELAGGLRLDPARMAAYRLTLPASPHIAAAAAGMEIDRAALLASVRAGMREAEFSVVEGVGGFRVPLGPGFDTADLAVWLGLPVLLVVRVRLGCINHALLTGEAIAARGLRLAAWVANVGVDPEYAWPDDTIATLEEGLGLECGARLGRLPGGEVSALHGPDGAWRESAALQSQAAALSLKPLALSWVEERGYSGTSGAA